MFKNKKLIFCLSFLLFLCGCPKPNRISKHLQLPRFKKSCIKTKTKQEKPKENQKVNPNITIWIHGTYPWPFRLLSKYRATKPFLIQLEAFRAKKHYLKEIAETLCVTNSEEFVRSQFYFLRWSGKLSTSERAETAELFYKNLENLHNEFKAKHNVAPEITLITHSHGGNVALNLARVKERNPELKISRLILLACPVQKHTVSFAEDSLFKKIYSFYSTMDVLQVIDPQGFHYTNNNGKKELANSATLSMPKRRNPFFSQRTFPTNSKLSNIKVKLNGKGVWHTQFLSREFISYLPRILDCVEECRKNTAQSQFFITVTSDKK